MSIGVGMCCVNCQTYLAPRKNSVFVLETMEDLRPYKVWQADLFECPDCGHQIVAGFGQGPLSEHYKPDFGRYLKMVDITINGCPRRLS